MNLALAPSPGRVSLRGSDVVEAGMKALRDGHHGHTPSPGIPRIREAVAAER